MIGLVDPHQPPSEAGWVETVREIFSPQGLLSKAKNFEYRPQQQAMAVAVAEALASGRHLMVEAGTGVGKSLGYLVPAIYHAVLNRRRAVVCTHTINLQEQLIEKDLPMLTQILPVPFTCTMLKGRGNYLCTRRLRRALQHAESLFTSPESAELKRIEAWSKSTADGSLSDFDVEPDMKVWSQVCSERGLCSPKVCGPESDFARNEGVCFFQRARGRILSSDVLVLNHTLFFTLLGGMEEEPGGGVLFKNDFVIFDEAHTVEQVAARHIGFKVSNAQLRYALQRLYNPSTQKGLLTTLRQPQAIAAIGELIEHADLFFGEIESACDGLVQEAGSSGPGTEVPGQEARGGRRARAWGEVRVRRSDLVEDSITLPITRVREAVGVLIKSSSDLETGAELLECNRRLAELKDSIAFFIGQKAEDHVYWVERTGKAQQLLSLNAAPVDVAAYLRRRLFGSETSIILTSATLATATRAGGVRPSTALQEGEQPHDRAALEYLARRVGAESARMLRVGSPFDYETQMRLFVAGKMPDPRDAAYPAALAEWIRHFVRQTHGKAFVLFTSFRLMHELARELEPFFRELGVQCFVQGTGTPRSTMLEAFKQDVDSVLFGTDSFWQGVDVPGEALSNVIITRLPFAVPDHPLIEARIERIEAEGGNAFFEFSLPEAILKFRQGVGRLIRSKRDTGIVAILDNRVLTKRYGQAFLDAIPKCPTEVV